MDYKNLAGTALGAYQLETLIAADNNITAVYRAHQVSLKRAVAVNVFNPNLPADLRRAFVRGAEIIAEYEHPNIVPIHDCGQQDQFTYTVMRLMTGDSLHSRLKNGPMPLSNASLIVRQIANALDYVHSRGKAHGDPSTTNIIFDEWGSAYISNFTVAGFLEAIGGQTGTPNYMAPERWNEQMPTSASDQYALGCITYHMITGKLPFEDQNLVTLAQKHLNEPPSPVQDVIPEIPRAVNDVLNRALAKLPEDRYPTVMDFAREFETAIQDVPKHLFISYSRRDKDYAQQLNEHLSSNGFTVWIDSRIEYGNTWFKEIDDAIKTCTAFLLVMSPESYESEWVQKEILLAKRYKKPIFPLLLEGEEFGIVIDLQFADVRGAQMPDVEFHRRLRRTVFGDA